MTRKDYELIAQAFRDEQTFYRDVYVTNIDTTIINIINMAERLAESLAQDNPRFNRDKFIKACTL